MLQPQLSTIKRMLSLTSSVNEEKILEPIKKDMKEGKESCEGVESTARPAAGTREQSSEHTEWLVVLALPSLPKKAINVKKQSRRILSP